MYIFITMSLAEQYQNIWNYFHEVRSIFTTTARNKKPKWTWHRNMSMATIFKWVWSARKPLPNTFWPHLVPSHEQWHLHMLVHRILWQFPAYVIPTSVPCIFMQTSHQRNTEYYVRWNDSAGECRISLQFSFGQPTLPIKFCVWLMGIVLSIHKKTNKRSLHMSCQTCHIFEDMLSNRLSISSSLLSWREIKPTNSILK